MEFKMFKTLKKPHISKLSEGYLPPNYSWLPDWKIEKEYAYLREASLSQFAWEFLRRNKFYVNFRSELKNEYSNELLIKAKKLSLKKSNDGTVKFLNSNKSLEKFHNTLLFFERHFCLLNFPPDPSENLVDISYSDYSIIEQLKSDQTIDTHGNKVVIVYDLDLPNKYLEKLISEIKEVKKRREIKNFQAQENELYIRYLRILDAKKRNYKNDYIAEILFPEEENHIGNDCRISKKVQDSVETAEDLVNGRYKLLGLGRI